MFENRLTRSSMKEVVGIVETLITYLRLKSGLQLM